MTTRNGLVSVRDQAFYIRDPEEGGMPALVIVPTHCRILVNGAPTGGEVLVSSENTYEIQCDSVNPETKIEVAESGDRMSVTMTVHLADGIRFKVGDGGWTERLELRVLEETISAVPPTPTRIYEVLRQFEFSGQIDEAAVNELAVSRRAATRVVLRGRPSRPGRGPAYVNLPLQQHNDLLRRWRELNTVKAGTPVARYETGEPGEDGVDVHGKPIPAPMLGDALPKLGEGLSVRDNQVFAERDGRFVHSKAVLDVVPQLVMNEDIVAKEGFIEFDGDITISGSVMDGSIVRASGLIRVLGSVYGAHVVGFGGVHVANSIVNSQVVAGSSGGYNRDWQEAIESALQAAVGLRDQISEAVRIQLLARKEAEQRQRTMHTAHQVQQAKTALTECVITLKQELGRLCSEIAPDDKMDDRWTELARLIRGRWLTVNTSDVRAEYLTALEAGLTKYYEYVKSVCQEEPAHVVAESMVSSTIQAAGDVTVTGRGVVSCTVTCNGSFQTSGFVRGGSITAETGAAIHELGTALGSETRVKVNDIGGQIEVAIRHPNTWTEVGINGDVSHQTEYNVVKRAF